MSTSNEKSEFNDEYAEERELFKRALLESLEEKVNRVLKEAEEQNDATLCKEEKMKMNQFYREVFGISTVPYPEEEGGVKSEE